MGSCWVTPERVLVVMKSCKGVLQNTLAWLMRWSSVTKSYRGLVQLRGYTATVALRGEWHLWWVGSKHLGDLWRVLWHVRRVDSSQISGQAAKGI